MRRVRIEHEGTPTWATPAPGGVELDDGSRLAEEQLRYLAPAEAVAVAAVVVPFVQADRLLADQVTQRASGAPSRFASHDHFLPLVV